jgi:hypothetical protein
MEMITIKGIRIDDFGDSSVGIFSCYWEIVGEMKFDDEAELNQFKNKIQEVFEYVTDRPIVSTID